MNSTVLQTCVNLNLSSAESVELIEKAKDWNILHGSAKKSKEYYDVDQVQVTQFLLLPSLYPKKQFENARDVQTLLNELMHKVAHNYEFLKDTLKYTIEADTFTAKLFDIYHFVHSEGFAQNLSLGLIRSDYMLHSTEGNKIKQVEINLISTSFAGLASITSAYHKYILKELEYKDKVGNIPNNNAADGFARGLVEAWKMYKNKNAVILVVVEDFVYNIYDQRVIEFKVRESSSEPKIIRRTLTELITQARLGPNKELLVGNQEVAVVYYRSAYQIEAYPSEKEWEVRLLLERSRAIKCPSIHYHLAGTKKVQQQLAVPGVLEKFISDPKKVAKIKDIFMGLYSLDLDKNGDKAVAMGIKDPERYVLKPQREGGGNNVYGEDVRVHLEAMKNSKDRTAWILMERIYPPLQQNYVVRAGVHDLKMQEFVSELGVYGVILGDKDNILLNTQDGHILRTKPSSADEGGIVAGAGALDGPFLVD